MSVDTSAVHESIKLALDAADAATDVTTEYNRVKREHRNMEASVKQIHRYTTIIFSVSIVLGTISAVKQNSIVDKSITFFIFVGFYLVLTVAQRFTHDSLIVFSFLSTL